MAKEAEALGAVSLCLLWKMPPPLRCAQALVVCVARQGSPSSEPPVVTVAARGKRREVDDHEMAAQAATMLLAA
jgi:hypothetical protein